MAPTPRTAAPTSCELAPTLGKAAPTASGSAPTAVRAITLAAALAATLASTPAFASDPATAGGTATATTMTATTMTATVTATTTAAPSRAVPPDPGCEPQTLEAGPLRIDAWSCVLPTRRWHVRPEPHLPGFALWIDGRREATLVHALRRAPGAPLSSVLTPLAGAGLVPPDDCVFVRARGHPVPSGARAYDIRPTGARLAALRATPRDEVPDPPCGEYGWSTHGVRWFVVDPRHPRWVVYVNHGQDGMPIDPASLAIRDRPDAP